LRESASSPDAKKTSSNKPNKPAIDNFPTLGDVVHVAEKQQVVAGAWGKKSAAIFLPPEAKKEKTSEFIDVFNKDDNQEMIFLTSTKNEITQPSTNSAKHMVSTHINKNDDFDDDQYNLDVNEWGEDDGF
jgi:hypothetical protein